MNKHVHRLVFDRRRGMRVPAAEHVRSAGKAGGGESRATTPVASACSILLTLGASLLYSGPTMAQQRSIAAGMQRSASFAASPNFSNLPLRSSAANRLAMDQNRFNVTSSGNAMTIKQLDSKVIINWDSFNVGNGYSVEFVQPSATSSALNNIWSADPSVILGHIKANGEVILQNRNGILFGPTARVDTARFVATALSLTADTFNKGLRAIQTSADSDAAFGSNNENKNGFISVERGAEITALAGGDVIMVAPKVYNEGRISTPSGQTILAAGQKVWLFADTQDSIQRGLVVAVDAFAPGANDPDGLNTIEQAAAGSYQVNQAGETVTDAAPGTQGLATKINQVIADKGTINLVGLTVRQNGVLSATTAVKGQNGAIYLQATQSTTAGRDGQGVRVANKLGTVDVGAGSITSVTPDTSADTQTSSEAFYRSRINIDGKDVRIRSGALVQAVSGNVQVRAAETQGNLNLLKAASSSPDQSTLVVDSGATLSVAGLRNVALPMSRNQLSFQPFQIDLANAPVQRNGVIYRQDVLADARRQVRVADVTGFYNLIGRSAQELSTRGGNIVLASTGTTVVADGARLDISGGSVRYDPGQIYSSILANGQGLVSIENADPHTRYTALINPDEKNSVLKSQGSYVEGADAGSLSVVGTKAYDLGAVDFNASTVVGPLQRGGASGAGYADVYGNGYKPASSWIDDELGWSTTLKTSPWLYASLQPKSGTLALGRLTSPYDPTSINTGEAIHIVSTLPNGVSAVPEVDTAQAQALLASLGDEVRLSAAMVQSSGLGNLELTGQAITMDADVHLNLGALGTFKARTDKQINLAGQLYAEGGKVTLVSQATDGPGITLAPGGVIDVSGRVADERQSAGHDAVSVNGGDITMSTATSSVDVRGATLNVSGGLWFAGSARHDGKAGSLSITANKPLGDSLQLYPSGQILMAGATLSGYDFANGGTLTLAGVKTISIGNVPQDEQAQWTNGLNLADSFFSSGGFGTFNLSAVGDVKAFAGTQVQARLQNLYAPTKSRYLPGQSAVSSLQTLTLMDGLRAGVNISLTASSAPRLGTSGTGLGDLAKGSAVTIEQGALLDAGLGGSIALTAGLNVDVAGSLVAHGGQIALQITAGHVNTNSIANNSSNLVGYLPDEEIRLRSTALLDVSGASKVVENLATHRRTGSVFGGGTVTLGASSGVVSGGSIFTEAGSVINVSGATDVLDLGTRVASPTRVSAGAGTVNINTADGYVLQGTLRANRPDATVAGGVFNAAVTLAGNNDLVNPVNKAKPYPNALHETLLLGTAQDVMDATAGEQHAAYGLGVLSSNQLLDAGFDRITLTSDDRITLGAGANFLAQSAAAGQPLLRSLALNTHVLNAGDNQVHTLQAGMVTLGSADVQVASTDGAPEIAAATSSTGDATLNVQASLINLNGYMGLAGFGTTNLSATLSADQTNLSRQDGEIRLIGRAFSARSTNPALIAGQLNFAGQLNLTAGSLYATTLSNFTLNGDTTNSVLTVLAPAQGSTSAQPLTALGHLNLHARDITLDGPIKQSFGQVNVTADNVLTVGDHAAISVSGDGLIVPVGMTHNGAQWAYNSLGTQSTYNTSVVGLDGVSLLKNIALNGNTLSLSSSATLSADAGGDLQAWEFIPGVGGSVDELNKAGYFAVLPSYKFDYAPYDTEVMASQKAAGTVMNAGDQVTITTPNSVLAAGVYTLLPARYALLPGAVLVKATSLKATGNGQLTQASVQDDGSQLVSGYVGSAGTALGSNTAGAALTLIPQSTLLARSQYDLTSINRYKASQSGSDANVQTAGSAGRIQLASDNVFNVGSHFDLNGGGELDLYMGQKMAVVAHAGDTVDGYAAVNADALQAAGAQRVLLGGKREGATGDATVTAMSDEVLWATNVDTATDLITVAKDTVSVADGVSLINHGAVDDTAQAITLKGKGVALALSARVYTTMTRELSDATLNAAALGNLAIGHKVTLSAPSLLIDATGHSALPADLALGSTRALSLGTGQILLGAASADPGVLALTPAQLGTLSQIENLSLHATQNITTSGSLKLGSLNASGGAVLKSLTLDAPVMIGAGAAGDHVVLTAQQVNISNSSVASTDATVGQSDLTIVSKPVLNDLQTGGITIGGDHDQKLAFHSVKLDTTGDVVIDGKASTLSTQGDLTIAAARVTGTNLANKNLHAGGVLTVAAVTPDRHTLNDRRGAGQSLSLQGSRVIQAGLIDLASGQLNVSAAGAPDQDAVVFAEGSTTNLSGRTVQAGTNWSVSSQGGNIAIKADAGGVALDGALDVSAGPVMSASDSAKSAGEVLISATGEGGQVALGTNASISGHAALDSLSGKLSIDTLSLSRAPLTGSSRTLDRVAELVDAGQMAGEVDLRLRKGNQSLDTTLRAQRVNISVDQGSLVLLDKARIDATAPQGGVVSLSAHNNVALLGHASINADSTRAGANGGDVLLSSVSGKVFQSKNATVSAMGDDALDGRIVLRAGINADALQADVVDPSQVVNVSLGNAANLKAGEVTVEAVQVFTSSTDADLFKLLTTKSSSDAINASISNKADAFANQVGAIQAALGLDQLDERDKLGNVVRKVSHVLLGVELQSQGDLTLVNDWNLADLRLADEPINLSIRAAGKLNIRGNLSDGFETSGWAADGAYEQTAMVPGNAASMRLVGGADLSAANVMGTQADHVAGDVEVGSGKLVRTTAGSIEVAASHNVVLDPGTATTVRGTTTYGPQATIYVAGRPLALADGAMLVSELPDGWAEFTDHGGRLEVSAGHDVIEPGLTQLPGNWFYHTGGVIDQGTEAWWTGFDSVKQGFGSFGGGNIRVEALGNVVNATVVAPTSSVLVDTPVTSTDKDGKTIFTGQFTRSRSTQNGGDVTVKAGGDIQGGVFLLGQGQGVLNAGGTMDIGTAFNTSKLAAQNAMLGLMSGQWSVESRGDLNLGLVFNPTVLSSTDRTDYLISYFYTYGADSALYASSAAGGVNWGNSQAQYLNNASGNWLDLYASAGEHVTPLDGSEQILAVAPPIVRVSSGGGDMNLSLSLNKPEVLFPSAIGDLSLYASGAINISGRTGTSATLLTLADTDPATWPTVGNAIQSLSGIPLPREITPGSGSQVTLSTGSSLHALDDTPVRIYSGDDLTGLSITVPKAAEIESAGNLFGPDVNVQHFNEQAVSLIKAGGNIEALIDGTVTLLQTKLKVSGPGELRVEAGRNLDLYDSEIGVQALGNAGIAVKPNNATEQIPGAANDQVPDVSAKLSLLAGGAKSVSLSDFQRLYLNGQPAAQSQLVAYVKATLNLGSAALSGPDAYTQAMTMYAQMSRPHQVAFADQLMQQQFVQTFVVPGQAYADAWQTASAAANVSTTNYSSNAFLRFKNQVLMAEVTRLGTAATDIADSTDATVNAQHQASRQLLWDELNRAVSLAGLGEGFNTSGHINVASSRVATLAPGDKVQGGIDLYAPGGSVIVGLAQNDPKGGGIVTQVGGNVRALVQDDFQVNQQKAFVVGTGDLTIYASHGTIDSGRGSNSSVSAPQAVGKLVDGYLTFVPGAATTGSGLAVLKRPDGTSKGDVNLFAPIGGILALDAFVRNDAAGGSVHLGGPVQGADNIKGSSVTSTAAVAAPSTIGNQTAPQTTAPAAGAADAADAGRETSQAKSSLLTVDLISMGAADAAPGAGTPDQPPCKDKDKDCVKK